MPLFYTILYFHVFKGGFMQKVGEYDAYHNTIDLSKGLPLKWAGK